ncbi:MAG: hypothetical protein PBV01_03280 [Brucella anthropi]
MSRVENPYDNAKAKSFMKTLKQEEMQGLAPNIERIEKQSDHFTVMAGLNTAGWTMGGMGSSQCGLPLVRPLDGGNSMGRVGSFLPRASCLGDIMRSNAHTLIKGVAIWPKIFDCGIGIHCGVTDQIREVFEAFGLQMWEKVGFRAPSTPIDFGFALDLL